MPNLKFLENPELIVSLFAPGIIILSVRSQFMTGRITPSSATFLHYLTVSVVYYALAYTLGFSVVDFVLQPHEPGLAKVLTGFAMIFVGPAALGLLLGVNVQKDLFRSLLRKCRLNPVHGIPTAWDWKFGRSTDEQWVLVTLKDGMHFGGFYGSNSFTSSEPAERDIYIQRIYDIGDNDKWISRGEKGLLITAGEVRTIEFWPCTSEENGDEQK